MLYTLFLSENNSKIENIQYFFTLIKPHAISTIVKNNYTSLCSKSREFRLHYHVKLFYVGKCSLAELITSCFFSMGVYFILAAPNVPCGNWPALKSTFYWQIQAVQSFSPVKIACLFHPPAQEVKYVPWDILLFTPALFEQNFLAFFQRLQCKTRERDDLKLIFVLKETAIKTLLKTQFMN